MTHNRPVHYIPRRKAPEIGLERIALWAAIISGGLAFIAAGWLVVGLVIEIVGITLIAVGIEGGER